MWALFNVHVCSHYHVYIQTCFYAVSNFSITVWRHCWAARITRVAPHSTTLAGWVSMTPWGTCWASRGRSALHASQRTRSRRCTLPLSEFNSPPRAWLTRYRTKENSPCVVAAADFFVTVPQINIVVFYNALNMTTVRLQSCNYSVKKDCVLINDTFLKPFYLYNWITVADERCDCVERCYLPVQVWDFPLKSFFED